MAAMQRLDKILSNMGLGSRKDVKKLFKQGLVSVDETIVYSNDTLADPDVQTVSVSGNTVVYREFVYIMMNKPQDVLSATEDSRQKTAVDLLDDELLFFQPAPAGRLDKDTEGFLFLTNDGEMIHRIITPKKHVSKTYFAQVKGVVTEKDALAFKKGITLDDGYVTIPAELNIIESDDISKIELTIFEGKFHQIKRMFHAVGKEVIFLKRLSIGKLLLDENLKPGEYREITSDEIEMIFK